MRFLFVLLVVLLARAAVAQVGDTTGRPRGTIVSGVVTDSIAHKPLAGATVQLVADNFTSFARTAVSDSLGRFAVLDVPAGSYKLGFFHPLLDSLGVDAPLRGVSVNGKEPARVDLAIPSPARLRAAICGAGSALDSSAVLVGVVRSARNGAPAAGVTVTGRWLEFSFTQKGMVRRVPRLVATTGENGWFALCNVPTGGTMALIAGLGSDSTDLIEVQVSAEGFVRRDLYLGLARTVGMSDNTNRATDAAVPSRRHFGDATLSGTVIAAVGGRPLGGAQVAITAGPQTRANASGEWTLSDAPTGTRMLEVRAVGYYPERRAVNIVAGAPSVRVALSTLKAVLDTVRIVADRLKGRDRTGFEERRRRSGSGRFLTPEDIARRQLSVTSDIFRFVPGLIMERNPQGETPILMRGMVEDVCYPAFYLDGAYMKDLSAEDIDGWVHPKEIAGIEVYAGAGLPPQFQRGQTGCGSIVIWTR